MIQPPRLGDTDIQADARQARRGSHSSTSVPHTSGWLVPTVALPSTFQNQVIDDTTYMVVDDHMFAVFRSASEKPQTPQ